ncbi:hypothetical protein FE257_002181 [Aspergillus nanangensis]|uniref:F-box domain-containing protein n=1 Tax=Aspergillus nanangensis TaxID=2582783 RepID=A0AAD4CCX9_ASPNN|nr:hypothetical protein FE257_002181 [Aspergillus nanangensis]
MSLSCLPVELLLEIIPFLDTDGTRSLSLVNNTFRSLTVANVFRTVHISFTEASFRRFQELCQSPFAGYVHKICYKVPFLWEHDPAPTYDALYKPFHGSGVSFSITLQEQRRLLGRDCKVVLGAVGLSRNNPVPIQEVDLDIFSSLESIETLGLKQSLQEGLAGVKSLQLRGQYRFWEGALELDVFDSLTDLTLTDCTMLYEILKEFTWSKKHQLRTLTLVGVGLLPYSQLGYLRWSGTLIDAIPWLLKIPSLAAGTRKVDYFRGPEW